MQQILSEFILWFIGIVTRLFHTVNVKNIVRSNPVFQHLSVIINEFYGLWIFY